MTTSTASVVAADSQTLGARPTNPLKQRTTCPRLYQSSDSSRDDWLATHTPFRSGGIRSGIRFDRLRSSSKPVRRPSGKENHIENLIEMAGRQAASGRCVLTGLSARLLRRSSCNAHRICNRDMVIDGSERSRRDSLGLAGIPRCSDDRRAPLWPNGRHHLLPFQFIGRESLAI